MVGLRLFSVLAQSMVLVLTGLMTCQFGGKRLAQTAAVLAVALSPLPLFQGTEFQYTSFDYLWWVLCGYLVLRLLNTDDRRWWLAIGAVAGIGLMTKYTILFLVLGILSGFTLTRKRYLLKSRWFAAGSAIAFAIFLPNLLWQAHHGFISFQFLQFIHQRDVRLGRTDGFLWKQIVVCVNIYAAPLWATGLGSCWRNPRYRPVTFMFTVPFALLLLGQRNLLLSRSRLSDTDRRGRDDLCAMAPNPVLAMASDPPGSLLRGSLRCRRLHLRLCLAARFQRPPHALRARQKRGPPRRIGLGRSRPNRRRDPQYLASSPEIRRSDRRGKLQGTGRHRSARSRVRTSHSHQHDELRLAAWLSPPAAVNPYRPWLLTRGCQDLFTACRLAGHNDNAAILNNEESREHPDIFVCGGPDQPWPKFWKEHRKFG